jgi:predicted nucleic acid-binding protein
LSETIGYLYPSIGASQAQGFINTILACADTGLYLLVHLSPQQFRRAWLMRQKYHDKPHISFVDFTSVVVMQDHGIVDIFTGDQHFRQVNLGFRLHP